jgi:DNA-directed RNA polymerases I, II, and III subunit RPABC2
MSSKVKTSQSTLTSTKKKVDKNSESSNKNRNVTNKKETKAVTKTVTKLNQNEPSDNSNKLFANQINSRVLSTYETDYRDIMMKYDVSKNITRPKITQYEKALVLGKRATQISSGAKPNITVKVGMNVVEIATEELRQKKVPFIIKRPIGNKYEYWKIKDLIINLE